MDSLVRRIVSDVLYGILAATIAIFGGAFIVAVTPVKTGSLTSHSPEQDAAVREANVKAYALAIGLTLAALAYYYVKGTLRRRAWERRQGLR